MSFNSTSTFRDLQDVYGDARSPRVRHGLVQGDLFSAEEVLQLCLKFADVVL